ncbi:hypothetical protein FKN01_02815 [Streptomyces sp. 130]|uniref:hypothetical protein n=1 Tax=Streptomyces sp. 130 TaxID=2591006 RepID=UPI00117FF526|nr:hypothetical protein [Streptomyces sp. 130]TRV81413.1 hypothetical protein FKN01_02815 [Streptomyces sp. 130]
MSADEPIPLEGIPVFTGDLALLDVQVSALTKGGEAIETSAGDVHSSFGGLQAFYRAPEADQLFATTRPVADRGISLKSDLATITSALSTYSQDAEPLIEKLKQLKRDAGAFRVKINADDKWREDGDLVDENNRRRDEIAETWAAFQAVERACYNKIVALVDGAPLKADDGSGKAHTYGYDAEALKHAEGLPWGDPVEESRPWWQHVGGQVWDFAKGFVVDGVWGTIKGLGTLVGAEGWDSAKQAWSGLGDLATGLAISGTPLAGLYWGLPDDKLPSYLRDSRKAMKETGKALLAWDQWSENPSRALGAVSFNVVTTVVTGGTGGAASGAGKAALAAKALSTAGKVGRVVDPMTYVFKGAGMGLTKIGDGLAALKGLGKLDIPALPEGAIALPEGAFKLPDGTLHLPEGAAVPEAAFEVPANSFKLRAGAEIPPGAIDLGDGVVRLPEGVQPPAGSLRIPEGTLKLPEGTTALPEGIVKATDGAGNTVYLDGHGNLLREDGTLLQHHSAARQEGMRVDEATRTGPTGSPQPTPVHAHMGNDTNSAMRAGDTDSGRSGAHRDSVGDLPSAHSDGVRHDSSGSHEQPSSQVDRSSGGHHGGSQPLTRGHDIAPDGGRSGPGSGETHGDLEVPYGSGAVHGWDAPPATPKPFERGGDIEQQIRAQLRGLGVKPDDLENALTNLSRHSAGEEIADIIASGKFKNTSNFGQVVSSLSHFNKMPGSVAQLRLANRLLEIGVHDISFEIKGGIEIKPGVETGAGTDLDVMARDTEGRIHGYQFKNIENPKKVVKKAFDSMKQLEHSGADFRTFVVDTKGTLADHAALRTGQRLAEIYGKYNIQFIIRLDDGVLTIPPGGTFTPGGTL